MNKEQVVFFFRVFLFLWTNDITVPTQPNLLVRLVVSIREVFDETATDWEILCRDNGNVTFGATLPHSVTTWEVNAVSVAPTGGICVADPLEIVASKSVFVEVNLPYSVIKNEQIEVPATVYNYGKYDIRVCISPIPFPAVTLVYLNEYRHAPGCYIQPRSVWWPLFLLCPSATLRTSVRLRVYVYVLIYVPANLLFKRRHAPSLLYAHVPAPNTTDTRAH